MLVLASMAALRHDDEQSMSAISSDFLLTVVMPVYNEQETLRSIVDAVQAVPVNKELVLVDDGSTDDSRAILAEL